MMLAVLLRLEDLKLYNQTLKIPVAMNLKVEPESHSASIVFCPEAHCQNLTALAGRFFH